MKSIVATCLSFALCLALFTSCKKSDDSNTDQKVYVGCLLQKMYDSSTALGINTITTASYDIYGNMVSSNTTGTTSITRSIDNNYSAPLIRISGAYVETDTLSWSGNLLITWVMHNYTDATKTKRSHFYYDNNGVITTRIDFYNDGIIDTAAYSWSNGDLVYEKSRLDSTKYTYDADSVKDGDWLREDQILTKGLGKTYINNVHRVHSYQHGLNAATYFFYLKDDKDRIVTCNSYTGSTLRVYTYTYYCTQ